MKKFKFRHPTNRLLVGVLVLIVGLNVAVLWYYGQKINTLWLQNGNDTPSAMTTDVKFYIKSAIGSLYNSEPATDVAQSRLYVPEAKIYLPLTNYSRAIVYRYDSGPDSTIPASITMTSKSNINAMPVSFADVPCMQRHLTININNSNSQFADGKLISTVKLSDTRTLYIYKHDEGACSTEIWGEGDPDKLLTLVKQAKSY